MTDIKVDQIEKRFPVPGGALDVLASVSFGVESGRWLTCIGPSGCGKTTLLRLVAGLLEPDAGAILLGGTAGPRLGRCAYLPQDDTLLPWRNALDNATLPAEIDGRSRIDARHEALALFERFGLRGFEALYPSQLSGGMRQRVELARMFLSRREVLLLDEPLGALDPLTRLALQDWLVEVWTELHRTILLVTHDIEEAVGMSDEVLLLTARPARVRERASFAEWRRPRRRADPRMVSERARLLALLAPEVVS